ncbi:MAG: GTPase [Flavobacteriales bacterium]|nr:MAG: GTPase [Flavobacteriales bacterium]
MNPEKLIFIYNADSGIRNVLLDGAHKIFSPSTYQCSLCTLTYGAFAENNAWKNFRKETNLEMEFLHKNEFVKAYASKFGHKFTFPIVLATSSRGFEVLISTEELNTTERVADLIGLIRNRAVI